MKRQLTEALKSVVGSQERARPVHSSRYQPRNATEIIAPKPCSVNMQMLGVKTPETTSALSQQGAKHETVNEQRDVMRRTLEIWWE